MTRNKIILLLLAGLLTSCFDDGDCRSTKTDLVYIDFRTSATDEVDTVEIKGVTIAQLDSVFYEKDTTTSITLPLDPNVNSLVLTFEFETANHELTLDYITTPQLITVDCGVELSYSGISVAQQDFDSVVVRSSILDEQITSNIVIYQ